MNSAKEWYDVYNEITNIIQGKPFDKEKFLHYLRHSQVKVKKLYDNFTKNNNILNKDLEWTNVGVECQSFIFSNLIDYGLQNGVTLEEIQQYIDNLDIQDDSDKDYEMLQKENNITKTYDETVPSIISDDSTIKVPIDIPDHITDEISDDNRFDIKIDDIDKNELPDENDVLNNSINDFSNYQNTIEKVLSITMNKDNEKNETVWCVNNRIVVSDTNYFSMETIWLVLSLVISFVLGFRYLVSGKKR
jgi:hypothetical protein